MMIPSGYLKLSANNRKNTKPYSSSRVLRHTFASHLVMRGEPLKVEMTQRALGEELCLSVQSVNLIIKGERGITQKPRFV